MNMLILYNPYYQADVIEAHLAILKFEKKVAFGKIKSAMRQGEIGQHSHLDIQKIAKEVSPNKPLQLFLSDYANLFVCKVVAIDKTQNAKAPEYYQEKGLCVEWWFCIEDMRELVRNDFTQIRDKFLSNWRTPYNGNRTYALYGNNYTYPLLIELKNEKSYFSIPGEKHYHSVFKREEQIQMRKVLLDYVVGLELEKVMCVDTMDNLVNAEVEFAHNKKNPLYDCTGIVMLYAKSVEQELLALMRPLVLLLSGYDRSIQEQCYGGNKYILGDWLQGKSTAPSLTELHNVLKHRDVQDALELWTRQIMDKNKGLSYQLKSNLKFDIPNFISFLKKARNPIAHEKRADIKDALALRNEILGVGRESVLVLLLRAKLALEQYKDI